MNKYSIEIEEILQRNVKVEAETEEEAIKKVKDPFQNLTVKDIMKDLLCGEATANAIFKRDDFPSINIGKTKTVTYVAYLIWKSTRKEEDIDE